MQNHRLADYIKEVNKKYEYYFAFAPNYTPVTDRPVAIDVRFDPKRCVRPKYLSSTPVEVYVSCRFFENKKPFVRVASVNRDPSSLKNRDFAAEGAFTLEIMTCSPDYSEQVVIDVLKGIVEEYFAL